LSNQTSADPATRIEGQLRVEAVVDRGVVVDAFSTGTPARDFGKLLRGRDPREAWSFTERIGGVCTTVHALASCRAVEDALGLEVPANAQLVRNLMFCAQFIQDHVVHFYHRHALDWLDAANLLQADPAGTSRLAKSLSSWPDSSPVQFAEVQGRLRTYVEGGQPGQLGHGFRGHAACQLPPDLSLLVVAHYLDALPWQMAFKQIHATFGGRSHHPDYQVGGVPCSFHPDGANPITDGHLAQVGALVQGAITFVEQVFVPDLMAVAGYHTDWARLGGGLGNFLAFGDLPSRGDGDPASFLLPRGAILGRNLHEVHEIHRGDLGLGGTEPEAPWLQAPRFRGEAMEVGPLARMLVAYVRGSADVKDRVDAVLERLGLPLESLFSTLGRTVARGIEAQVVAHRMRGFLIDLNANLGNGDPSVRRPVDPETWPAQARGLGLTEAPRGALAHALTIQDAAIADYRMVIPTTWNASPRDAGGLRTAWEAALIGTPVANARQPVELLRTLHAFDPCQPCALRLLGPDGGELHQFSCN